MFRTIAFVILMIMCSSAWLILLLLATGCEPFGGSGGGIDCDDQYRAQVVSELNTANAKLEASGHDSIGEDPEKLIVVRTGEKYINGGWKVWYPDMGKDIGGWVAGLWSSDAIMVVSNPDGVIRPGRLEHEWAHEILYQNHVSFTYHHQIMKAAGIPGS